MYLNKYLQNMVFTLDYEKMKYHEKETHGSMGWEI